MARGRARSSGQLEGEVIACLAAAGRAMTPAEVKADLGDDLAYTTVLTALTRLHGKQALTRHQQGRAHAYELAGGSDGAQASMTAHQMQKLLAAEDDRASVLSRFVDGLDGDSETILRELLEKHPLPETAAGRGRTRKRTP